MVLSIKAVLCTFIVVFTAFLTPGCKKSDVSSALTYADAQILVQQCIDNAETYDEILACTPAPVEEEDEENSFVLTSMVIESTSGSGNDNNKASPGPANHSCTTRGYHGENKFADAFSLDPNADAIWPGAIVQGNSISSGHLAPIGLKRAPGTIVIDGVTFPGGSATAVIEEPAQSTVINAMQELLSQPAGGTSASVSYEIHQANSFEEIAARLRMDVMLYGGILFGYAEIRFQMGSRPSIIAIDFTQVYYTVSFEPSSSLLVSDFFNPGITPDLLKPYVGYNNPPAYVATVTYGRRVIFIITSKYDLMTLGITIGAYVDILFARAEASFSADYKRIVEESDTKIMILGGPSEAGIKVFTSDNAYKELRNYIQAGASFDPASPGFPISYTLRWLQNLRTARVSLTTDYQLRTCEPVDETIQLSEFSNGSETSSSKAAKAISDGDSFEQERGGVSLMKDGKYLYALGGGSSNISYARIEYNGTLSEWKDTDIPLPESLSCHKAIPYGERLYLVGGGSNAAFVRYIPFDYVDYSKQSAQLKEGESWSTLHSGNFETGSARTGHAAFIANRYLYVIGGDQGGVKTNAVSYGLIQSKSCDANDECTYALIDSGVTFSATGAFTTSRSNFASMITNLQDGSAVIYIAGGQGASEKLNDIQYAVVNSDGTISEWHVADYSLPVPVSHAKGVAVNGFLYVMGGEISSGNTSAIYYSEINRETGEPGQWGAASVSLPEELSGHDIEFTDGKIYIAGGSKKVYYTTLLQ